MDEVPSEVTASPAEMYEPGPAKRTPLQFLAAFALALMGGVFGIIGAFVEELRGGLSPLLIVLGAPIIEEVLKPSGLYVVVARWPHLFRRQVYIAVLSGLAGLVFGVLESTLYVKVYADDPSGAFIVYRFTVTVLLHVTASSIVGWGVSERLVRWASYGGGFPKTSRNAFIAAIALHAIYNLTVTVLSLTGTLDFN
jgi:RsiW-degrading membrane proteinase PrsW (M82 family)